ncbi:MAG: hypothetical protein J07HQW1_01964 [Haloquadratum walsbyi J07HQW1]|uniref:Uncharacterized protein n=1 Tax=Haloquadratum walsbyi J07HQW1 TaxID=1238424 RepID=U1N5P3_9EURY|nr:MAG: hypothetical protein J07HQW1_01964 [Haloquadratum walsbyi J07HQW1]
MMHSHVARPSHRVSILANYSLGELILPAVLPITAIALCAIPMVTLAFASGVASTVVLTQLKK